jgi:hypothetical protein
MARINRLITVGANAQASVRICDGATSVPAAGNVEGLPPCWIEDLSVQLYTGAVGLGYLMLGVPLGVQGNPATNGHLTAILSPSTIGTDPGGQVEVRKSGWGPTSGVTDGNKAWVSGTNPGDKLVVSYERID